MPTTNLMRILIVDDNPGIHNSIRALLANKTSSLTLEQWMIEKIPGPFEPQDESISSFIIDSAFQGQDGLALVQNAVEKKQPYALAIVDVRMPPGWDGIVTIQKIWEVDPHIQVVICSAYSDYSWEETTKALNHSNNYLVLNKPFEVIEMRQLIAALTKKWELNRLVQHQIENLESMVQHRTLELQKTMVIAEKANLVKSEFLANMSVEFQNPLNVIIGFVELMNTGKANPTNYKEYFGDILSNAKHLSQMIQDMLEIANIENGIFDFKPKKIDLENLVDEIISMFHYEITQKDIKIEKKIDPILNNSIELDPEKLKQVIFHYFFNAIKFNKPSGKVTIHIFPFEQDQFKIEVKDTGVGIREEDIKKLFVPFQQLDSSITKRYQGIGIGLALVRKIVEAQNGQVGLESTLNQGTTFFAVLPKFF